MAGSTLELLESVAGVVVVVVAKVVSSAGFLVSDASELEQTNKKTIFFQLKQQIQQEDSRDMNGRGKT